MYQEYKKRSKVSVTETGSELMIGAAGAEDGGEYNCSLTLGGDTQSVVHTVVIKGGLPAHFTAYYVCARLLHLAVIYKMILSQEVKKSILHKQLIELKYNRQRQLN